MTNAVYAKDVDDDLSFLVFNQTKDKNLVDVEFISKGFDSIVVTVDIQDLREAIAKL